MAVVEVDINAALGRIAPAIFWTAMLNGLDWKLVIPICGMALSAIYFLVNRRATHKSLTFDYDAVRLHELQENLAGKLVLTFEGAPVANVSLVTLWIKNSGNVSIKRADFDQVIGFDLKADRVLSVELSEKQPADLDIHFSSSPPNTRITFEPVLLNVGDEIKLSGLITGFEGVSVFGHVDGVIKIKRRNIHAGPLLSRPFTTAITVGLVVMLVTLLEGVSGIPESALRSQFKIDEVVGDAVGALAIAMAGILFVFARVSNLVEVKKQSRD